MNTPSALTLAIGRRCPYCNDVMQRDKYPTRDHCIIPKHRGGKFSDFKGKNRVICCVRCNGDKG